MKTKTILLILILTIEIFSFSQNSEYKLYLYIEHNSNFNLTIVESNWKNKTFSLVNQKDIKRKEIITLNSSNEYVLVFKNSKITKHLFIFSRQLSNRNTEIRIINDNNNYIGIIELYEDDYKFFIYADNYPAYIQRYLNLFYKHYD
jgi:hypothetical protein